MDQFILFGDSLTQQAFSQEGLPFGAALSDAYIRRLDIVDRGFSGYNTSQALAILPKIMPHPSQARVRMMAIFFGANDARMPDTPGGPQQHVAPSKFQANLRKIATHPSVLAHEGIRIMLVAPPPVDETKMEAADLEKFGQHMVRRKEKISATYVQIARSVAADLNLPILDLSSTIGPEDLRDGLHFTSSGYKILYTELMKLIAAEWPDQLPSSLPFVFPAWDDEQAWSDKPQL